MLSIGAGEALLLLGSLAVPLGLVVVVVVLLSRRKKGPPPDGR